MSKGEGKKIVIKFTEDLVGDVGNKDAFAITGKEYKYVNGPLVNKEYQVEKVERYPVQKEYSINYNNGVIDGDLELVNNQLQLELPYSLPTDGLKLWLDADIGVTKDSNNLITQWHDNSGNGNNATATTKPLFIDGAINGRPAIRFTGLEWFDYPNLSISKFTGFIVMKAVKPNDIRIIMGHDPMVIGFRPASSNIYIRNGNRMARDTTYRSGEPNIMSFDYGTPSFYVNGVETNYGDNANISTIGRFIGKRSSGSNYIGDIAEIIIYNRVLTVLERKGIELYLRSKYNILLGGV